LYIPAKGEILLEVTMNNHISNEILSLFESLLRAQLHVIRQLRKASGAPPKAEKTEESMSHMDIVHNILQQQGKPVHVNEIIVLAQKRFNVKLDKESLVSAITKRIKRHDRFIKTGPNTFSLLTRPFEEER